LLAEGIFPELLLYLLHFRLRLFEQMQREHGWEPLRGNHEDFVIYSRDNPPKSPLNAAMRTFTDWTARQMGPAAAAMKDWPDHAMIPDAIGNNPCLFFRDYLFNNLS